MEFISKLRKVQVVQSITKRLSNSQTRYSMPVRHNSEYRTILTSVCALFTCDVDCCLYMYQVLSLTCSTHGAQPQTLACNLLALS